MNCVDKRAMFARLFGYFKGHYGRLGIAFACVFAAAGLSLVMPMLTGWVFIQQVLNTSEENESPLRGQILLIVGAILAINLINMVVGIIRARVVNQMSVRVTQKMKLDMFDSLQKQSLAYYSNNQTGRIMNRISSDPEVIRMFYTDTVPSFVINLLTFAGVAAVMFFVNWQLTLIVFIPIPLIVWIFRTRIPRLWKMLSKRWRKASSLNAMLGDSLTGIRVVKAFSKEVEETNRFAGYSEKLYKADLQVNLINLTIAPVVALLISLTGTMIWGFGGVMVMKP
jgi:ATP-binding cassette subfamily B protein